MNALTWLQDKVYWRRSSMGGGQQLTRPKVIMRCGRCDGLEMARRGWEDSGPESPPNKK